MMRLAKMTSFDLNASVIRPVLLLGLWAACFWPVYPSLLDTWLSHSDHSHGLLVPFISLAFVWQKRTELMAAKSTTAPLGAAILFASLGIYLISLLGGIAFTARLMIVFSLAGLVLFQFGKDIFRMMVFPIFFLAFMIPIPVALLNKISLPLQMFATVISEHIVRALSIPVYREGNMLYFAQTQLEVAEACSGIRSITALVMISTVFVYISNLSWSRRWILLVSAIPIALIANILRVAGTGILAHFYGARVARGFLHEFSGMAVFAFGLILLYFLFQLLNRNKSPSAP